MGTINTKYCLCLKEPNSHFLSVSHINLADIFYYMELTTFYLANKKLPSSLFSDSNDMHKSENNNFSLLLQCVQAAFQ